MKKFKKKYRNKYALGKQREKIKKKSIKDFIKPSLINVKYTVNQDLINS